jgi:methylated-DNA-[protein]-cysteine S-methyltransferase
MTSPYLLRFDTPIGRVELLADEEHLTALSIERDGALPHDDLAERPNAVLDSARSQLLEYFAGARTEFDIPVRLIGTPFQQAVWAELVRLGWGEATSYGALAAAVGRPGSARAIGGAVIPTKLWLLAHERIGFAA